MEDDVVREKRREVMRSLQEQVDLFHKEGEENDRNAATQKRSTSPPDRKPENVIPDLPENKAAREFLKSAPAKGLHMPLGKEVKVMQCWRCKAYGHRTGDKDCPLNQAGNIVLDAERQAREDPMTTILAGKPDSFRDKKLRAQLLRMVLEVATEEERKIKKGKSKDPKQKIDRKSRKSGSQERPGHYRRNRNRNRSRSRSRDRHYDRDSRRERRQNR